MYIIKKEKDDMRRTYREIRQSLDNAEKARRDAALCRAATSLASYRYAKYVLLFAPTDEEIDVMPIARDAMSKGKRVAFPKSFPETHTMEYRFVDDISELSAGYSGILEPASSSPLYDSESMGPDTVCFVPGLVYDTKGYRLGYGKGFYDRYLSSFGGNKVGVVYSDFIVPSVPHGRFDVCLKILLTEKGVVVTGED